MKVSARYTSARRSYKAIADSRLATTMAAGNAAPREARMMSLDVHVLLVAVFQGVALAALVDEPGAFNTPANAGDVIHLLQRIIAFVVLITTLQEYGLNFVYFPQTVVLELKDVWLTMIVGLIEIGAIKKIDSGSLATWFLWMGCLVGVSCLSVMNFYRRLLSQKKLDRDRAHILAARRLTLFYFGAAVFGSLGGFLGALLAPGPSLTQGLILVVGLVIALSSTARMYWVVEKHFKKLSVEKSKRHELGTPVEIVEVLAVASAELDDE